MDLRRSSASADRRRRLLSEESALAPARDDADVPAAPAASSSRRATRPRQDYTPDASWEQQPRITDLIPRRILTICALFTLGVLIVAGLEWLYAEMPNIAKSAKDGRVAAFDLDGEGSLSAFFSSVVLMFAGFTALLIYSLRRHRLDDYRARYRIWLWGGLCWFVMAIDESGSLHEGFKEFMAHLVGRLYGDGSLWWVIAYGGVLGLVGLRLLWEMRVCRASTTAISLCALCFAVAVIVQLQLVMPERGAQAVMVEEGCEMAGALFLLLAMALHARFIIFDIEGKYRQVEEKASKASKESAAGEPTDTPDDAEVPKRSGRGLLPWRLFGSRKQALSGVDAETEDNSRDARRGRKSRTAEPEARERDGATSKSESKPVVKETPVTKPAVTKPALTKPVVTKPALTSSASDKKAPEHKPDDKPTSDKDLRADEPHEKKRGLLQFWKRKAQPETETVGAESRSAARSAAAEKSSASAAKPSVAAKASAAPEKTATESKSGGAGDRQLTKAERKALRRERRRQERDQDED